jgi:hypothetical protein
MKKPEIAPLAVLNAHNPWLREGRKKAKNHRPKILPPQSVASKKLLGAQLGSVNVYDSKGYDDEVKTTNPMGSTAAVSALTLTGQSILLCTSGNVLKPMVAKAYFRQDWQKKLLEKLIFC